MNNSYLRAKKVRSIKFTLVKPGYLISITAYHDAFDIKLSVATQKLSSLNVSLWVEFLISGFDCLMMCIKLNRAVFSWLHCQWNSYCYFIYVLVTFFGRSIGKAYEQKIKSKIPTIFNLSRGTIKALMKFLIANTNNTDFRFPCPFSGWMLFFTRQFQSAIN